MARHRPRSVLRPTGETVDATTYTVENAGVRLTSFLNAGNYRRILFNTIRFRGELVSFGRSQARAIEGRVPSGTVLKYWSKLRLIAELFQMRAALRCDGPTRGREDRKRGIVPDRTFVAVMGAKHLRRFRSCVDRVRCFEQAGNQNSLPRMSCRS